MTNIPTKPLGRNPLEVPIFGMGTAPVGNLSRSGQAEIAIETLQHAYEQGIRLIDTAPLYGLGGAEECVGKALEGVDRESYIISTKVGRVLHDDGSGYEFDFSYDGVMRSFESSLERLQTDHVEIVHIHDPDNHRDDALDQAFPTLADLRDQGVIRAVGSGMNQWQMLDHFANNADFDLFLLAGRYTLLEQTSLAFLENVQEKGIGIFLGGVYNSGILATGPKDDAKYNYQNAPEAVLEKARQINAICQRHNVPLNVAALQFAAAHPAVTSMVIGAESPDQVEANLESRQEPIPADLWEELRKEALIEPDAPVPG